DRAPAAPAAATTEAPMPASPAPERHGDDDNEDEADDDADGRRPAACLRLPDLPRHLARQLEAAPPGVLARDRHLAEEDAAAVVALAATRDHAVAQAPARFGRGDERRAEPRLVPGVLPAIVGRFSRHDEHHDARVPQRVARLARP